MFQEEKPKTGCLLSGKLVWAIQDRGVQAFELHKPKSNVCDTCFVVKFIASFPDDGHLLQSLELRAVHSLYFVHTTCCKMRWFPSQCSLEDDLQWLKMDFHPINVTGSN